MIVLVISHPYPSVTLKTTPHKFVVAVVVVLTGRGGTPWSDVPYDDSLGDVSQYKPFGMNTLASVNMLGNNETARLDL